MMLSKENAEKILRYTLLDKSEQAKEIRKMINEHIITIENPGNISDGSHTFDELYYHRMVLFSILCDIYRNRSWKSLLHHDGTMYDNYFIVGIDTPKGQYSYHYHTDYWDYFNVQELPKAPQWDGHEPKDVDRLLSLLNI